MAGVLLIFRPLRFLLLSPPLRKLHLLESLAETCSDLERRQIWAIRAPDVHPALSFATVTALYKRLDAISGFISLFSAMFGSATFAEYYLWSLWLFCNDAWIGSCYLIVLFV